LRALLAIVIGVVGVLAIVAGVLYLTQPAHDLPSFFPGYVAHASGKHPTRGIVGVIVGAVLIVVGLVVGLTGQRRDGGY
jgi:drug/metabolite transporter (DMT)-like permease